MDYVKTLNANIKKTLSKGRVALTSPTGCPSIKLYLFDPDVLQGPLSHEEAQAVVADPAYWSFCWASGQVLASYILAHPELVADKIVVDFGCGSGVVAIASSISGAKKVYACDIDRDALDSVAANAEANQVSLIVTDRLDNISDKIDLITAADVLYDKENYPLLDYFTQQSKKTLIADSRVKALPSQHYDMLSTLEARTWPDLNEFEEFNQVNLYISKNEQ